MCIKHIFSWRWLIWLYVVLSHVNWNSVYEHAQNIQIQINLHMRKVSSGHLLSVETFNSIQWVFADSKGPDQTAHDPKVHFRLMAHMKWTVGETVISE